MSSSSDEGGEKTLDPTPKRLEDARKKGDIPRSEEVTTAIAYLGLLLAAALAGGGALAASGEALAFFLDRADRLTGVVLGPGGPARTLGMVMDVLSPLAPFILVPMVLALVSLLAQRGIVFAGSKLEPKLSRISPKAAIGNKFGPTGLVEFLKRFVKMVAVSIVALYLVIAELDRVVGAAQASPAMVSVLMLEMARKLLVGILVIAGAIALLDLAWVRFDHMRKLRMSYQEMRDETKEAEGDPMLKGRRRRRAMDIATNRMLADVPKADVVIVNPTHYAVALTWSRTPGSAPRCVAKGVDEIAGTMREMAAAAGVPIHRDPPTARALHAVVEIGAEIPVEHYRAVAAAIRFAEDMRARARQGWQA